MSGFTSTGIVAKTIEEIRAEIVAEMLAKISATLDLSEDQPMGQAVAIFAQREAIQWELLVTLANAIDPDSAEDFLLDAVCKLTGTQREPAKKSKVFVNCTVSAGFTQPAGAIMVNVSGQSDVRFVNKSAVGPLAAGTHSIEFESVEYGPIVANAGTLTVITAPVSGLSAVTNPEDADPGALREEDTLLRVRREDEIAATGACTIDSLRADVLQVKGVEQCFVFENTTLATDADGLPGKAVEVVVFDGSGTPAADNLEIATAIWKGKPSGSQTYGNTLQNVTGSDSVPRAVYFSRAVVKGTWLDLVGVVIDPLAFPANGEDLIKAEVAAYALKKQNLGVDVIANGMKAAAMKVPGVIDVPLLKLGFAASPSGTANLLITGREIASIDTSRISVTTTPGTP